MNPTKRHRRAKAKKYQQAQIRHAIHNRGWVEIRINPRFLELWRTGWRRGH